MNWLNIMFGGFGGALIAASVALYIHHSTKPKSTGLAYGLLKKLQFLLKSSESEYYFTKSADENYQVAKLIYSDSDAEIIATAFNENPEKYGESDVARGFRYASLFTRITSNDVCPTESAENVKTTMQKILRGSRLVVASDSDHITKIDGIFCRFKDSSYLCAIAFRDPKNIDKNKGVVFRDGIAEGFFEYYKLIADKYSSQ